FAVDEAHAGLGVESPDLPDEPRTVGDELELVLRDRAAARDLPALEGDPCGDEVGDPRTTRVDRVRELDDELEAHGVAEAEPRGGARGEGTRGARVTGRIHRSE